MKRKLITFLLCFGLAASMTGCGRVSGDAILSGETVSGTVSTVSANEATLKATTCDPVFQIGSSTLTLGKATVQDVIDAGASFDTNGSVQSPDFSEDPEYARQLSFKVGDTTLSVVAKNEKNAIRPISSSVIESVSFNGSGVCGIGGVATGDTAQEMTKKLGEEYLIENAEDFQTQYDLYGYQNVSIPTGSRVYFYSDVLNDCPVLVSIDRNTSSVNYVSESLPVPMITKPSDIPSDSIWQSMIAKANQNGAYTTNTIAKSIYQESSGNTDVTALYTNLNNLKFTKLRFLAMNAVKDAAALYERGKSGLVEKSVASTYLVFEYEAEGVSNTTDATYGTLYGCFYVPNPALSNRTIVNWKSPTSTNPYVQIGPVFRDETELLSYIVSNDSNKDLGYTVSDFTIMDKVISFDPAVDTVSEDGGNEKEKDEYATDVSEASSTASVSGNGIRDGGTLTEGTYTFGKDIRPGRYAIALKDGKGYLQIAVKGEDVTKADQLKITKKEGLEATFSEGDQILVKGITIELQKVS